MTARHPNKPRHFFEKGCNFECVLMRRHGQVSPVGHRSRDGIVARIRSELCDFGMVPSQHAAGHFNGVAHHVTPLKQTSKLRRGFVPAVVDEVRTVRR